MGQKSKELFERAKARIPGGVNSPVRAFRAVGGEPLFLARGRGARVWDVDGQEYVDYVGSWGPLLLGHAHPEVHEAIVEAASQGTSFGAPTEREVRFAEVLCAAYPSMDKVRLVSSGTEATMAALRVARGATGREAIVKIDGAYHGHADCLLVAAGSGAATLGIPGSKGVTAGTVRDTLTVPWNDLAAMAAVFEGRPGEVAAVIVEPVCGNMGCVPPRPGYLEGLRELTRKHGVVLIFDEVMTGFRLAYGGAQARYGIVPDMTCLGKIVGGGLPVAAYGGRADLMAHVAPEGPVYQAGTLSGNPLAVAAGLKTVEILQRPGTYERLEASSAALGEGLAAAAREAGVPLVLNRVGSMLTGFFMAGEVWDYGDAKRSDAARFGRWFRGMLEHGVYLPPSQFEAAFVSLAHGPEEIERTLAAARAAFRTL
ncbi:MAG TPA: glutamate-1-semialdehyde 2,1-aminomutase [Polyangia bacterium]|jgi:glutamate-1-semialdehyde 2,1-aminomutase|nr:glutamate-1-semialdehyde 2,1-aminomutase [Polyangia bacterium]